MPRNVLNKFFNFLKSRNDVHKTKSSLRMEMHTLLLTVRLMNEFNLLLNIAFQDTSGESLSQEAV